MFCVQCGQRRGELDSFCPNCGAKHVNEAASKVIESTPSITSETEDVVNNQLPKDSEEERTDPTPTAGEQEAPSSSTTTKPSFKEKFRARPIPYLVGLGSVITILLAVTVVAVVSEQSRQAQVRATEALQREGLSEAFSASTLEKYQPSCDILRPLIEGSVDVGNVSNMAAQVAGVSDPRTAGSLVRSLGISSSDYEAQYRSAVEPELETSFENLIASEKRASTAPEFQVEKWRSDWSGYVLGKCELAEVYASNLSVLADGDQKLQSAITLAASAPWYPDGFFPMDDSIAYRWIDPGSDVCGYSACVYWRAEVIANYGCSDVYGEISITQNGTAVAWTNDNLTGLGAGQTGILTFKTYEFGNNPGAVQAQMSELTCY